MNRYRDLHIEKMIHNFDPFAEYAYAVKTICDKYALSQDDLLVFSYMDVMAEEGFKKHRKKITRFPINLDIPNELAPIKGGNYIRILGHDINGSSDTEIGGYNAAGITELQLISPYTYKTSTGDKKADPITVWEWRGSREYYPISPWCYFIHRKDHFEFCKAVQRITRSGIKKIKPPVLAGNMLREIYDNSIGFLIRGHNKKELYNKYNIAYKRGLLLVGPPGCGKTMTCKWLRQLCIKNKLSYKIVTMEAYRKAMSRNTLRNLFKLDDGEKGLIFFDDMDQAVKSRESGNPEISTFLTALDGIESNEGVVYVFTTNYMKDLDAAFVRPGRIDVFMTFDRPSKKLRRTFIENTFEKELLDKLDVDELISESDKFSFAEIEEIRKLLCIDMIDGKELVLKKTIDLFQSHRKEFEESAAFGYAALKSNEHNDDDDDEGYTYPFDSDMNSNDDF